MSKLIDKISMYGVSHALVSAGLIAIAWFFIPNYYAVAVLSFVTAFYWFKREAKARRTIWINDWKYSDGRIYWDSIFDFISPFIISVIAVVIRY